jgi:hypothetical protein
MDRLTLTQADEAAVADTEETTQFDEVVAEGTNLIKGDHVKIADSWDAVIIGGQQTNVWLCVPAWGSYVGPFGGIPDYVTDRAGPNGETMPIRDEQQMQAMLAKAGGANPKHAKKDARERLRDFLALQSADVARAIRKHLQIDDKDDKPGKGHA